MTTYQYNGEFATITFDDIAFTKGEAIELSEEQVSRLKASTFGKHLMGTGELIEVKATAKPSPKATKSDDIVEHKTATATAPTKP